MVVVIVEEALMGEVLLAEVAYTKLATIVEALVIVLVAMEMGSIGIHMQVNILDVAHAVALVDASIAMAREGIDSSVF